MKQWIFKHLTRNYTIENEFLFYNGKRVYYTQVMSKLELIFNVSIKRLKRYIKSWWLNKSSNRDFKKFVNKQEPPNYYLNISLSGSCWSTSNITFM